MTNIRCPMENRKTTSLTNAIYPQSHMLVYPMGYYIPNTGIFSLLRRTPTLNDSDSSDDDIPLSQVCFKRELNGFRNSKNNKKKPTITAKLCSQLPE